MTLLLSYDLSVQQYDVCRFIGVQAYFADRAVQPLGDVCRTDNFGFQPLYGAALIAKLFVFLPEALRHLASQYSLVYFRHVEHSADLVVQPYYLGAWLVGCFGRLFDAVGGYRAEKVGECGQQLGVGYLDSQTAGRVLTSPTLLAFASAVVSAAHSVTAAWASDGDGQLEYVLCFVHILLCVAPMLCFLYFLIGCLVYDRRISYTISSRTWRC